MDDAASDVPILRGLKKRKFRIASDSGRQGSACSGKKVLGKMAKIARR